MREMDENRGAPACEMNRSPFRWLNVSQFLGALNDNILKLLIILFIISQQGSDHAAQIGALASVVFVVPFLLFSATAGILADRFSKGRLIVIIKGMEVLVTLLALTAFWSGSEKFLYLTLFLMASHSALFAPAKYGIVPELVPRHELSRANGLLEMLTYLAIVAGAGLAPLLAQLANGRHAVAAGICVFIALAGLAASLRLPATPVAATGKKLSPFVVVEVWRALRQVAKDRYLLLAVIGTAYFMFVGAFAQINLLPLGMGPLGLGREQSGYLFLAAAIGIGIGSFMAGRLSGRNVEFGVVPIGALALTVAALGIGLLPPRLGTIVPLIILLGIGAGLFIVPLQAFIQLRAPRQMLGEVLAAGAFLGWSGVLVAAALTALIPTFTLFSPTAAFTLLGLVTLLLSIITLWLLPDFLIRFIALLVMRSSYRIRVMGADNVPLEGPALLVANHVSWVDALLLMATQQRRLRFIMEREIYNQPLLRPLFRLMGVIPVSARDSKRQMADFMIASRQVLDDGYLLCIFAEGAITRNGMIREFRPGFERIVRGTNYPIIPVYIGGAWGSILSYAHGRLLARFPSLLPYPVSIIFGTPLPASTRAALVKQAVMELSCDYFESRKSSRRPLAELFVQTARENLWRKGVADSTGLELSYGRLLVTSLAVAKRIEKFTPNEPRIGILLPPSVAGVVANLAVSLRGRVGVNLNYTASPDGFTSAMRQSGIRTVITSRTFLAKVDHLPQGEQTLYVEDLIASLSLTDKLWAMVKGYCLPVPLLLPSRGFTADSLATIIFSSGSTGDPKGVMLSHHNIQSNLEALRMVFRVEPSDNICSALPFFHSLGFTGTLWLPLLSGFSASYHPNPLDGASIAELAHRHRSTILLATPTFLLAYLRRGKPEAFATLRLVVTGAEKLPTRTADAFAEKFGIRPLEGYGATELSPVITLSLPEVAIDGVRQVGAKEGSVGHPIPGVVVRTVDPASNEPVAAGMSGLILVRGPNVMLGYLDRPDKTAEVVRNGWYDTGDIGFVDEEGFLHITDRLARFSKIGGEMVPHGGIEEELHRLIDKCGVLAVSAVPDDKRGERIVVLHTPEAGDGETLHRLLVASSLPNLWKPGREGFIQIDELPLLGSGKLDLRRLKEMALAAPSAVTPS